MSISHSYLLFIPAEASTSGLSPKVNTSVDCRQVVNMRHTLQCNPLRLAFIKCIGIATQCKRTPRSNVHNNIIQEIINLR